MLRKGWSGPTHRRVHFLARWWAAAWLLCALSAGGCGSASGLDDVRRGDTPSNHDSTRGHPAAQARRTPTQTPLADRPGQTGDKRLGPKSSAPAPPGKTVPQRESLPADMKSDERPGQLVHLPQRTPATVAQLAAPAITRLHTLQRTYISRANALFDEAVREHQTTHASFTQLYNTYFRKGMALADSAQDQVNQILFQLQDELRARHLPTTIVRELRSQYKAQAEAEMRAMARRVAAAMQKH